MADNHFNITGVINFFGCYHNERAFFKENILGSIKYHMRKAAFDTNLQDAYDHNLHFDFSFAGPTPDLHRRDVDYNYATLSIIGNNYADNKEFWINFFNRFVSEYNADIISMNVMLQFQSDSTRIILNRGKAECTSFTAITLQLGKDEETVHFKGIECVPLFKKD